MKTVTSKIKEDDRILKRFNRLGKSELYLDLLYFLRFGSARYYLSSLLDPYGTTFFHLNSISCLRV